MQFRPPSRKCSSRICKIFSVDVSMQSFEDGVTKHTSISGAPSDFPWGAGGKIRGRLPEGGSSCRAHSHL